MKITLIVRDIKVGDSHVDGIKFEQEITPEELLKLVDGYVNLIPKILAAVQGA